MTNEQGSGAFAELDRLFHEVVDLPPADREAALVRVRARSPALADQLAALLDHDQGPDPLGAVVARELSVSVPTDPDPWLGERFGAYVTERVIGRGGMGAVYLAHRVDEAFQQQVAIKTIPAGLASHSLRERFQREREILATLNHPAIARLLDGGTGPGGVPFVAMEFVEGVPITTHVMASCASLRRRLELFLELCAAVAFVHRNLIVHRDIKPGNVLVTGDGAVKLLDFGIARLTDELDAAPGATGAMTPEYASPEQILGQPVTTAIDVYALGVLLYELLTDERPVRGDLNNLHDLAREIVSTTPPPPSQSLRTGVGVASFPEPPARIARQLKGDLDGIVLMAMRKEPDRRYPSVTAMADDVRAWLAGRPVAAQGDSWPYRMRKLIGRHPLAAAATVLFVATVAVFTGVTLRQSRAIGRERDNAVLAAQRATATSDFLTRLFTAADPRMGGNRNTTALEVLQAGVENLRKDAALDPRVRAELYLTLGHALANQDNLVAGIAAMRASLAESERAYGRESLETAERLQRLGDVLRLANQFDEAFTALTEALTTRRRLMPAETSDIADSYNNLAILAAEMGKYEESDRLQTESVALHTKLTGPASWEVAGPLNNLALNKRRQGRFAEALSLSTRAYEILRTKTDRDSMWLARANIAGIKRSMGAVDEAQNMYEELIRQVKAELGPTHVRSLNFERDLAECLIMRGAFDQAGALLNDLDARTRSQSGPPSQAQARQLNTRGRLSHSQGRLAAAERELRQAIDLHLAATGPNHYRIPPFRRDLATVLIDSGRYAAAEAELRQALATLPDPAVYPYLERAKALTALGRTLRFMARSDEARAALREAAEIVRQTAGEASPDMRDVQTEMHPLETPGKSTPPLP
jgi:serine/threonine-protein kinase